MGGEGLKHHKLYIKRASPTTGTALRFKDL